MIILGINYTQDAGITFLDTEKNVLKACRKERRCGRKHAWGERGDFGKYYSGLPGIGEKPVDVIVESFSSDPLREQQESLQLEIKESLGEKGKNTEFWEINHHLAHLYSVLPLQECQSAVGIVIDCMGSPRREGEKAVETLSVYHCRDGADIECIAKEFWDARWGAPAGLGAFYFLLARCFYSHEGCEGKVMALASYGDPEACNLPSLKVEGFRVSIPPEWLSAFESTGRFSFPSSSVVIDMAGIFHDKAPTASLLEHEESFIKAANLAAAGQHAFEKALCQIVEQAVQQYDCSEVLLSGGTMLNCVALGKLACNFPSIKFKVPPAPDDGGTAIGSAIWGAAKKGIRPQSLLTAVKSVRGFFSITPPSQLNVSIESKRFETIEEPQFIKLIVSRLLEGHIVGFCQGNAEFGPRALGFRSIIADPRSEKIRDFLNSTVKGREWYRPVAPVVLLEAASDYFGIVRESEFMQIALPVRTDVAWKTQGVSHIDGTARLQTLVRDFNPALYDVIKEFGDQTGCPMLINTSFNPKESPIVETWEEASEMLLSNGLDLLVVDSAVFWKIQDV